MSTFIEIKPEDFKESPFQLIGKDWMLVTAGNENSTNTMTAAWGGFGVMWNKNVAYVVLRPQRFTKKFVDAEDHFSLTFFADSFKKELGYLGSVSGRDEDKIKKAGLTLVHDQVAPYFSEAKIVLFCKKLYVQEYKPECFLTTELDSAWYPEKDYHILYIAEITKILTKK